MPHENTSFEFVDTTRTPEFRLLSSNGVGVEMILRWQSLSGVANLRLYSEQRA